jgi:hypothetical protein
MVMRPQPAVIIMYNIPMPVEWIEHKGIKILHINVSNLANDHAALSSNLETLISLLKTEPRNSVLAVADLRNTHLNNNALMVLMRNAPIAAPYFRKSALVIEPNNARRIVLDSFSMVIKRLPKRFNDLDAAKDWLVDNVLRLNDDMKLKQELMV